MSDDDPLADAGRPREVEELKTIIGNRMALLIQSMREGDVNQAMRYRGELRGLAYGVESHRQDQLIAEIDPEYVALTDAWEAANDAAGDNELLGRGWE